MEVVTHPNVTIVDVQTSGVSWPAIAAGAAAAAALTLLLTALGAGLGLSSVSPWADSGVSATTFKVGTGIYLCCVAVIASAVGGYLAARLRTKWAGVHSNEMFFRDTAHGFLAWAFATLLIASVLATATTHLVGGALQGAGAAAGQAAQAANPAQLSVDKLFRAGPGTPAAAGTPSTAGNANAANADILRLWTSSFRNNGDLSADDRAYVARTVSARTGLSQAEAERRVNDVITEAKRRRPGPQGGGETGVLVCRVVVAGRVRRKSRGGRRRSIARRYLGRSRAHPENHLKHEKGGECHGSRNPALAVGRPHPDHHPARSLHAIAGCAEVRAAPLR